MTPSAALDVLAVEGLATTSQPYSERRALLEELDVEGPRVRLVATFEDGDALFAAVCDRGLEGVVAKRERDPYRPRERQWVKVKNRAAARFAEERAGIGRGVKRQHDLQLLEAFRARTQEHELQQATERQVAERPEQEQLLSISGTGDRLYGPATDSRPRPS